ncbi:hypothetical protein [Halobacillus salinus]|uniref:Beta-carotene 15,15'-monooxygenase n=1 Tax=Halobacillus salinus TaxID=192814 RepID=A0A4Z0GYL8_9BACI|nr:hypothetical protein [Halobacillus salinus]TGB01849.1 hypothetical protein E4663_14530 [Halobacillus salinus]
MFIGLVLLSNLLLYRGGLTVDIPPAVVLGTLIDMLVIIPTVLFLFVLRRKPTLSVFVPLFFLSVLFIQLVVPSGVKSNIGYLNTGIVIAEGVLVLSECLLMIVLFRYFLRWKRIFREADGYHLLPRMKKANELTFQPPRLTLLKKGAGLIVTDAAAIRYSLLPHLDTVPKQEGAFSYHKKSEYLGVFLMLVHAMAIEIIAVHAMLAQYNHTVAWVATILDVYALLFIIADYQAIRKSPIIIRQHDLHIQKGLRFHIDVPIHQIKTIHLGKEPIKHRSSLSLTLTGLETPVPDFVLTLRTPLLAYLAFGRTRSVRTICISVDEPERFLSELQSKGVEFLDE